MLCFTSDAARAEHACACSCCSAFSFLIWLLANAHSGHCTSHLQAQEYEEPGESPLPQEEMDECVSEAMRLVLAQNEKKPLCPVPYTAITARLKQLQQRKSGIAKAVIAHAQKKFLNFGYELVEIKAGATFDD